MRVGEDYLATGELGRRADRGAAARLGYSATA